MPPETKIPNNFEIDQALKEFEKKSAEQQIELAEPVSNVPKMVQLVIKWSGGAIKEQRQAEYLLLGIVILNVILTVIILLK